MTKPVDASEEATCSVNVGFAKLSIFLASLLVFRMPANLVSK